MAASRPRPPQATLSVSGGRCKLEGAVIRTTVPALASEWKRVRPGERVDRVELGGVDQLDSAGIAFLLSMGESGALALCGLPERFQGLAALYRLEPVLFGKQPGSLETATDAGGDAGEAIETVAVPSGR